MESILLWSPISKKEYRKKFKSVSSIEYMGFMLSYVFQISTCSFSTARVCQIYIYIYIYIFTYISIYTYIYTFIYIYIYISLFNLWFTPFFHVRCTTFRFHESSNICSLVYLWIPLRINRSFIEQSTNRDFFEKQFSFPSPCKRRCSVWHWWMGPPIRSFHNLRPFKATDPARKHIKLPSSDQLTQDWVKCMTSGLRM